MPTVLFSLLATVFPNPAPTPAATPPAPNRVEARFDSGQIAHGIPAEVAGAGLLFVRGRIKDAPFWFLLDSAAASAFGERQAVRVGLKSEDAPLAGGGQENRVRMSLLHDFSIQFPGVTVTQPAVSCFDLDPLQVALGHRVDGILGSAFFGRFVIEIDFQKRVVSFVDPGAYPNAMKRVVIPIDLDDGLPYLSARVTLRGRLPLSGQFLIDTTADNAVQLFSPFVNEHKLLTAPGKSASESPTNTGGESLEGVLRAEAFEFAGFVFPEPVITLSRSTRGKLSDPRHAGLIGGEILRRFKVTFDSSRRRLILDKNAHFADPFDHDASGVALQALGPDLTAFEVRRVLPGSPGAEAGLLVGDILLAVDGRPAAQITLRGIRQLFRQDGKQFVLSVLRRGEFRRIRIKCRRLL